MASGIEPARNRKPVAPMNSAFEALRASKYIATGGDQIELKPPRTPAKTPMAKCQIELAPKDIFVPNIWLRENDIIANPIVTEMIDFAKDIINKDVKKILTIIDTPKSQYFFAISTRLSHPKYWKRLVKIIGKVSKDIAIGVSITKVSITIAAGGRPMPRKPFMAPAKKNAPKMISVTLIS